MAVEPLRKRRSLLHPRLHGGDVRWIGGPERVRLRLQALESGQVAETVVVGERMPRGRSGRLLLVALGR